MAVERGGEEKRARKKSERALKSILLKAITVGQKERERGEAQARLLAVQTAKAHDTDQNAPHHAMPCYNGEDIMQNRN
jgi:hypothetical protein